MQSITLKRGSSFAAHAIYTPAAGQAPTLEGLTFKSQVRSMAGLLIDELAVTVDPDSTGFVMRATNGTAAWPVGTLVWDIKVSDGNIVTYTETVQLVVEARVTE